jgi:hypothetical protein
MILVFRLLQVKPVLNIIVEKISLKPSIDSNISTGHQSINIFSFAYFFAQKNIIYYVRYCK